RSAGVTLTSGTSTKLVVDTPRLVSFRTYDVQAACGNHRFVFLCGFRRISLVGAIPGFLRRLELLPLIVEADHARRGHGIQRAFGYADCSCGALLDQILFGDEFGVASEQNVGTATSHVGGDGHHTEAAGLCDDLGFALVELCV